MPIEMHGKRGKNSIQFFPYRRTVKTEKEGKTEFGLCALRWEKTEFSFFHRDAWEKRTKRKKRNFDYAHAHGKEEKMELSFLHK